MSKLTRSAIDALEPKGENLNYLWDSTLPGFGVRCSPAGVKAFVLRYRLGTKQRIKTIGRVSTLDISEARDRARAKLAEVHKGADPFVGSGEPVKSVNDLRRAFTAGRNPELKAKTRANYESLWAQHICPAIGTELIVSLSDESVARLRSRLAKKPTTFNRACSLILSALKWKGIATETHPFKRVKKFKENHRQRILTQKENADFYAALGKYKADKRAGWRYADLFILLLLTGLRRDEWRTGRWEWVSWPEEIFTLPDNKTGGRLVYLSSLAIAVLNEMWVAQGKPKRGFIFPAPHKKNKAMSWTWRVWDAMRRDIALEGFRIHDMRHTAGSYAHSIGKLTQRQVADYLGHQRLETSSRYIHDDEKRKSAEIAAGAVAASWQTPDL